MDHVHSPLLFFRWLVAPLSNSIRYSRGAPTLHEKERTAGWGFWIRKKDWRGWYLHALPFLLSRRIPLSLAALWKRTILLVHLLPPRFMADTIVSLRALPRYCKTSRSISRHWKGDGSPTPVWCRDALRISNKELRATKIIKRRDDTVKVALRLSLRIQKCWWESWHPHSEFVLAFSPESTSDKSYRSIR